MFTFYEKTFIFACITSLLLHLNRLQFPTLQQRAERLHLQQPDVYKDSNHKPELAIALSPFEALCGFRPINEIKCYIEIVPELRAIIGQDHALNTKSDRDFVKNCFKKILNQETTIVAEQLTRLINRLSNLGKHKNFF